MAGGGKRNRKKNKEKSKNSNPNPEHEQPKILNNVSPLGKNKALWNELYEKVKSQYQKVIDIMAAMDYSKDVALKAILINGRINGPSSTIFANILRNCVTYLETGRMIDARQCSGSGEPILKDLEDVVYCSTQALINEATNDEKSVDEVVKDLLSDNRVFLQEFSSSEGSKSKVLENESTERLITESVDSLRKLKINSSSAVHQLNDISPSFTPPKGSCDNNTINISDLTHEVDKLEKQLNDTKTWAQETVIQVSKRLNNHLMELHKLRFENQEKQEIMSSSNDMEVSNKEHKLKTVNCDLARINAYYNKLEEYIQERKAEIAANQLSASENESALRLVEKEEKRTLRLLKNSEKKVCEIKMQIEEEKQNIAKTEENLLNAEEAEKDAKLRLMHEVEAKKQARLLLLEEERLNKIAKDESRRRLEAVEKEVDAIKQQLKQKNVEANSKHSCLFCSKKMADVLFLPCRHQVICQDCYAISVNILENGCPCCKVRIEKKIKVYGRN